MKIICVGRNYLKHANELNRQIPTEPVIFLKPDSAILKKNKPFFLPDFSENVQYETEIVVKICKLGKSISSKFAHRYYDELTVGIDITARDLQNDYISKVMDFLKTSPYTTGGRITPSKGVLGVFKSIMPLKVPCPNDAH